MKQYKALRTDHRILNRLQSNLVVALLSHWTFQSLFYMDRTERWFKVSLDVFLVLLYLLVFGVSFTNLVVGFLVAHTLNFLLNGHLYGVLKSFGISRANKAKLLEYLDHFARRVQSEPSIVYAAVYGSLSREELTDTSDLDIRVVRGSGWEGALRSCTFVFTERTRAFISGIPLDIYVLDNNLSLARLNQGEVAVRLKQVNIVAKSDVVVAVQHTTLHRGRLGKFFLHLVPEDTKVVLMDAATEVIRGRRKDVNHDPLLEKCAKQGYSQFILDIGFMRADTNQNVEGVQSTIEAGLSL